MLSFLLFLALGGVTDFSIASKPIRWVMLDVTGPHQADAHLLRFDGDVNYLIDAGESSQGTLAKHLTGLGVKKLEQVFISHLHKDHYSGLSGILSSGISVGRISFNLPERERCDAEIPWGCDWKDIEASIQQWKKKNIPLGRILPEIHYEKGDVRLETLHAHEGKVGPRGALLDLNDMSAVMLLTYGRTRVLFAGDLNSQVGSYLARQAKDLKADILKVPHHGAESLAPETFFDRVGPKLALVTAPKSLWLSERCEKVRNYLLKNKVPVLVSGIHGSVYVDIGKDYFQAFPSPALVP